MEVKKHFVFYGIIGGAMGAFIMLVEMEFLFLYTVSLGLSEVFGMFIPLFSIAIPQYLYHRRVKKTKYSHLVLIGSIAIVVMLFAMNIISYITRNGLKLDLSIIAKIIGVGTTISIVTAFIISFIKKRKTANSESLDDLNY